MTSLSIPTTDFYTRIFPMPWPALICVEVNITPRVVGVPQTAVADIAKVS